MQFEQKAYDGLRWQKIMGISSQVVGVPWTNVEKCPRPPARFFRKKFGVLLCFFSLIAAVHAQEAHPTESQVKAAYLYNFGKFVRWSSQSAHAGSDPFQICVLGKDPFGPVLNATVMGESIGDRKVMARRIASLEDSSHCRVLFVSSSEQGRLKAILALAKTDGVLTVSDMPHFADRGGMIEFVPQENKIRFEVNLPATEEAGLTLSSELLKVATRVIGK